jgi:hypothetical protein
VVYWFSFYGELVEEFFSHRCTDAQMKKDENLMKPLYPD